MSDWYALHVKSRFERYVTNQLSIKGYETFLPTCVTKRKWTDRVKYLPVPLFPGYVFCRFEARFRLPILMTPGVLGVVGAGKHPAPVDEKEIAAIGRVINSGLPTRPCTYWAVGEAVQVERGPLNGLVGIIVRSEENDLLVVSISLLMRSVSVEIDRNLVKPARPLDEGRNGQPRLLERESVLH